ncbi:disulfide isomerase [Campylobacter hyointestinalis]|uniref:disulfide isomerase n=1 Tax=Campylobacter hyointestinalis TaxID=198 RepID=UPI00072C29D7|nr:disulfide isomerase [Campylobacter hyointestinalis]PPB56624.1 disulfide isomerase [Campylobacter hyointestinalis subsp. hyointestinalis]CUU71104.1 disulfide isomerase [Campylobacter hyointestinalis]
MLKFKKLIVVSLLTLSTTLSAITEGVEYTKLKGNEIIQGADDKIIELFSYACIHCYNHFKIGTLKFVSEFLPEFKYEEWQVKQMGEFGYQIAEVLAYAKMIDEKNFINNSLNEKSAYHQVMKAYFEGYFKHRQRWGTPKAFYEVGVNAIKEATKKDVSVQDILDYASSEKGKNFVKRFDEGLDIAKISGTPAFIVKGKYLVNLEKVNSQEELVEIIKALVKLD